MSLPSDCRDHDVARPLVDEERMSTDMMGMKLFIRSVQLALQTVIEV